MNRRRPAVDVLCVTLRSRQGTVQAKRRNENASKYRLSCSWRESASRRNQDSQVLLCGVPPSWTELRPSRALRKMPHAKIRAQLFLWDGLLCPRHARPRRYNSDIGL